MKKLKALLIICIAVTGFAQQPQWRLGFNWGIHFNDSRLTGGTSEADARFQHNAYGGMALGLSARCDFDDHWMFSTGLGIQSYGFEYAIADNYSLYRPAGRYSTARTEFVALVVPAMLHYKFNTDCRDRRWVIGAGISQNLSGVAARSASIAKKDDQNINMLQSSSESLVPYFHYFGVMISRERQFRCGGIFTVSLLLNTAFRQIATSVVTYTLDGKTYHHEFTNTGNYTGLRLAWHFAPMNTAR